MGAFEVIGLVYLAWMYVFEFIGLVYLARTYAKSQDYDVGDFPFNFPES